MLGKYKKALIAGPALVLLGIFAFRTTDRYFEMAKSMDIMAAVYRDLNTYYVDSIDPSAMMQTGIEAMTQSLDPYTYYYSEDDLGDLNFQTTGKYGGVGTAIRRTGDSVVVTEVYDHAPFQQAGILPGDIIVSLEGTPVRRLSLDQISELLKGDPGSVLHLVIRHPYNAKPVSYEIKREIVDIRSVAYAGMTTGEIGYVKMIQFTEGVSGEVRKAVETLEKQHPGMKGLILDLRNNPGGLLNEAVATANLFLPRGDTILTTRGRVKEWNRAYLATGTPLDSHIPLAVLINRHSASASEIVAGAVQDLDRGIIVGQRSFGKGLVQTTRNLPYHTKIKITTARYYTPSGRCIQAIDYAHRASDGSITYIPDSLKKDFQTKDGRVVMDGGGIAPDQEVARSYPANLTAALISEHLLFDYGTWYVYRHPDPPAPGHFQWSDADFNDFIRFLKKRHFTYQTESETALEQFGDVAKKEGNFSSVDTAYQELANALKHHKGQDLQKHRREITRLLQTEIMSRYYFQKGRIAEGLATDRAVQTAAGLLDDPADYQRLLHKNLAE